LAGRLWRHHALATGLYCLHTPLLGLGNTPSARGPAEDQAVRSRVRDGPQAPTPTHLLTLTTRPGQVTGTRAVDNGEKARFFCPPKTSKKRVAARLLLWVSKGQWVLSEPVVLGFCRPWSINATRANKAWKGRAFSGNFGSVGVSGPGPGMAVVQCYPVASKSN